MKSVLAFQTKKQAGEKIVMATCYSHWGAEIIAGSDVDCILVGDSVAMVEHGYPSTVHATVDMMAAHVSAVSRGANGRFIVADMPFMSYRKGLAEAMTAVERLVQAGAQAVKLEGAIGNLELVKHIVDSGVPVMGHLGLTPQFIHQLGGYKVQGRNEEAARVLQQAATDLASAGCFSIVLECVPELLAKSITESLSIPTIGIGAGVHTSGQVLVFHDLLGLSQFDFKFVKRFLNGREQCLNALNQYQQEVVAQQFPLPEHSFT